MICPTKISGPLSNPVGMRLHGIPPEALEQPVPARSYLRQYTADVAAAGARAYQAPTADIPNQLGPLSAAAATPAEPRRPASSLPRNPLMRARAYQGQTFVPYPEEFAYQNQTYILYPEEVSRTNYTRVLTLVSKPMQAVASDAIICICLRPRKTPTSL